MFGREVNGGQKVSAGYVASKTGRTLPGSPGASVLFFSRKEPPIRSLGLSRLKRTRKGRWKGRQSLGQQHSRIRPKFIKEDEQSNRMTYSAIFRTEHSVSRSSLCGELVSKHRWLANVIL